MEPSGVTGIAIFIYSAEYTLIYFKEVMLGVKVCEK